MKVNSEYILGYQVISCGITECVDEIVDSIVISSEATTPKPTSWLACMNPHSYAVTLDDKQFSLALKHADWLVPDGAGIVLASKLLGGKIRERVTGYDIFRGVLKELNSRGEYKIFFLGSTVDNLLAIRNRLQTDYPNLSVAGIYSPPFKTDYTSDELNEMIDKINAAEPDVLWVGMTAPKQEKWLFDNLERLNIRFAGAIGAVFDFYTGKVKRSNEVFQRFGLEWLPRLIQQPRRLWRRMFISAPIFLWHVVKFRTKFGRNNLHLD